MSGNIFPGHQLVIKNVKPVTVKMWEIAHLAEFQTSAQSYGEAIQWEEWSVSPLVGSQQYWTLVNKGLIDVNEVSAAGARPGPEPVAAPLSAMGSVLGPPSTQLPPLPPLLYLLRFQQKVDPKRVNSRRIWLLMVRMSTNTVKKKL